MSYKSKFVAALVGMLLMILVASRQLFLFSVRDASGIATGWGQLLWLMLAASMFCLAGGLMFRFFNRHERNKWSKVEMTPTGPRITPGTLKPLNSPAFVSKRSRTLWLPEGQADDRMPMDGSVPASGQTPPGQRSFARRTHQLMFKKWSQARHD